MDVFTLFIEDNYNCDHSVEIYENENDALKAACEEIVIRMRELGMDDEDDESNFDTYNKIYDYIDNNNLKQAVSEFNDYVSECVDEYQKFFHVNKNVVLSSKQSAKTYINAIYNYPSTKKVITHPNGMNCCKCGAHNPYAEPNQVDDTYKCYKCEHGSLI